MIKERRERDNRIRRKIKGKRHETGGTEDMKDRRGEGGGIKGERERVMVRGIGWKRRENKK